MKRFGSNLFQNNLEILLIRNNCLKKIYLQAWRWNKRWSVQKTCVCDVAQYQWVFITSKISRLIGQDTEIKSFLTRRKISLPASTRCKANFSQFHAIEFGEGNHPCLDGKFVLMKLNVACLKCRWHHPPKLLVAIFKREHSMTGTVFLYWWIQRYLFNKNINYIIYYKIGYL